MTVRPLPWMRGRQTKMEKEQTTYVNSPNRCPTTGMVHSTGRGF